jgi:hypothetical protein
MRGIRWALVRALVPTLCAAPAAPEARAQPGWAVDARPLVDIARGEQGRGAFGTASWATRLGDGGIVVADPSGPALRWFDPKGTPVRSVGDTSRGPGGFRAVTWVGKCARDSVVAWDAPRSRITVLDEAGNVGRTARVPSNGAGQQVTACNRSGLLVFAGRLRRAPASGVRDTTAPYFVASLVAPLQLVDATGRVVAATGELPAGEILGGNKGGAGGGMPRPLGQQVSFALSETGLFVGTGSTAAIDAYSLAGRRLATLPLDVAARAPTRDQYARAADVLLAALPSRVRAETRAWVLGIPMPATLPPYSALHADPEGLVWAVLSAPGEGDTRLRALRADGRVVANVTVRTSLTVFEIGSDYVLGAREDAAGEQHVVVYRLRRGR